MARERDALLKEVDEELRREQFQKLWEQYGTYMIGALFAVLVGIGGYKWWDTRRIAASEAAGLRFEQALNLVESGKAEEAASAFSSIAAGSRSSYGLLAQLALAGEAVKAGKTDDAVAAYDAAAARAGDPLIKDFARLQSASLKIDTIDFTEAQNRLNDLAKDTNPWRFMASELLGVAAVRAGKLAEARDILLPLSSDPRSPAAVRERAGALMNLVVAAEFERGAPGKIELEKTDPPSPPAPSPAATGAPPKAEPKGKAATPKGGVVRNK